MQGVDVVSKAFAMFRYALRDASWLTADRALAFARVLLVEFLLVLASRPWWAPGSHFGMDFGAVWTAAGFALAGHPVEVYGLWPPGTLEALFGRSQNLPFFPYPPIALLLWLPFALVPFMGAVIVWLVGSAVAYVLTVGALIKARSWTFLLASPAVLMCVLYGQNSLLTTALLAGAALTLGASPVLAGVCLGCLAFKPQLALLAPLALAVAGRWRAFLAAAVTVGVLGGLSVAAFGVETWEAFPKALLGVAAWNAEGGSGFNHFSSLYAAARQLGAGEDVAWLVFGCGMAMATGAIVLVNRRRPGAGAEVAMLVAATGLSVPFLGEYELVIFTVPAVWLTSEALRSGWLPYEKLLLAILYLSPWLIRFVTVKLSFPLAPVALVALAALVARRASRLSNTGVPS